MKFAKYLTPLLALCLASTQGAESKNAPEAKAPPWAQLSKPLYQNSDNPFIQKVTLGGRMNYQVVHMWGHDANGDYFQDGYDELRRLWAGGKIDFLNYFQLGGNVIFASDERPQGKKVDFEYQKFFDLYVATDLKRAFSLDDWDQVRFRYGRIKHNLSYTGRQTQRFNKTVERTALSNKLFYPFAAMSATLDLKRGPWQSQTSLYGTANGGVGYGSLGYREWGNWDEGLAMYAYLKRDMTDIYSLDKIEFAIEGAYNFADADQGDTSWLGYQWASAASIYMENDNWTLLLEAALGDNGDEFVAAPRDGIFGGFQSEATYWLVGRELEAVGQFSWMRAENAEGIRVDRRYLGLPHRVSGNAPADINGRYGKNHISFYLGLNYYMPDDRNKVMLGIEWEQLDVEDRSAIDATTLWAAYRMYF